MKQKLQANDQIERSVLYQEVCRKYDIENADWFGGVYFNRHGKMTLQVAEAFDDCAEWHDIVTALGGQKKVDCITVKHSYKLLKQSCAVIAEQIDSAANRGIVGAGINVLNNNITVITATPHFELHTGIGPACRLSNGKCFFSAGYPAKKLNSDISGFITAGHLTDIAENGEITDNGEKIGTVYEYEYSVDADAAFIKTEPGIICDGKITISPYPKITGIAPTILCGAWAVMYGGESGKRYEGQVVYPAFDFMNLKNIMVFSYLSSSGDSGAPIVMAHSGDECALMGIHLGSIFLRGKCYSFGRAAEQINRRLLLELNI